MTIDPKPGLFLKSSIIISTFFIALVIHPAKTLAQVKIPAGTPDQLKKMDTDNDGLNDYDELYVYHTDPYNQDSDGDGYSDGHEVTNSYDPNKNGNDKLEKTIDVDLATQTLTYDLGPYQVGQFLISSGVQGDLTPPGEYSVIKKVPVINYTGPGYGYPDTKWNLRFKFQAKGSLYIHGAYWHHNFGHPMSHGCINVAYENMEPLYSWADLGTKITIRNEYQF